MNPQNVYRRYKEFCIANNFQALSNIEFSRQITSRFGFETKNQRTREGVTKVFVKGGGTNGRIK